MSPLDWFKKQKPLQSMQSLGGGAAGGAMAGGVSEGGPYSISGGTASTPGNGYKYFDFKTSDPAPTSTLAITVDGSPGYITFSFVAVGGGGAGGKGYPEFGSGGGGGGAFVQKIDYQDIILSGPDTWPISVGQGGLAANRSSPAGPANPSPNGPFKGSDSVITIPSPKSPAIITAYGGAGGLSSPTNNPSTTESGNYGSGGGAWPGGPGANQYTLNGIVTPAGVPQTIDPDGNTPLTGVGYDGGQGQRTGQYNGPSPAGSGGGGGGASQVGQNATPGGPLPNGNPRAKGGAGGAGRVIFDTDPGFSETLGGGGGGGQGDGGPYYQGGPGGDGGGGGGGGSFNYPWGPTASHGADNKGGGGGGAGGIYTVTNNAYSGAGGPGRVIFKIPVAIIT